MPTYKYKILAGLLGAFPALVSSKAALAVDAPCVALFVSQPNLENVDRLVLHTARLELRPLKLENTDSVVRILNDPAAAALTGFGAMPPAKVRANIANMKTGMKQLRSNEAEFDLGIFHLGQLIGTVNATHWYTAAKSGAPTSTYTIGYILDTSYHRRGFATEMLDRVLKLLFKEGHATEVQAYIYPHNQASIALVKKFGFVKGGSAQPKFHNYALNVREWRRLRR